MDELKARETRSAVIVIGLLLGCVCLGGGGLVFLSGSGVMLANQQLLTEVAPTQAAAVQAAATAAVSAQWPLVLADTFSDNRHDWDTGQVNSSSGTVNRTIAGGVYHWEIDSRQAVYWRGEPDLGSVSDFELTTTVRRSGQSSIGADYGVIFRYIDADNFYYFGVSDNGGASFQSNVKGAWSIVTPWALTKGIIRGQPVTIRVIAHGGHFIFYINGELAAQADEFSLPAGRVGLMLDDNNSTAPVSVDFDDFNLRVPLFAGNSAHTATADFQPYTSRLQWPASVQDGFDAPRSDWQLDDVHSSYANITFQIAGGKYLWQTEALQSFIYYAFLRWPNPRDSLLGVDVRQTSGVLTAHYGLVFRLHDSGNYYYFSARDAGDFSVWLHYKNNWYTLIDWTASAALKPGQVNRLEVAAQGARYSFYINGAYVGQIVDDHFSDGAVGLGMDLDQAGDKAGLEFDNFELREPPGSIQPSATATAYRSPTPTPVPTLTPTPQPTLALAGLGRIAFVRDGGLFTIDADGTGERQLTPPGSGDSSPNWSPDGRKIVFSRRGQLNQIYIMNADGSDIRPLMQTKFNETSPAWSPDGRQIAFVSDENGQTDIYRVNRDGTGRTRVTTNVDNDSHPNWLPDGKDLSFVVYDAEIYQINVIRIADDIQWRVDDNIQDNESPAWSPDGKWLAYTSNVEGNYNIYLMDPKGRNKKRLTFIPGGSYDPAWSPDGKYIVFDAIHAGQHDLYIMNADGSQLTRITGTGASESQPAWQP